RFFTTISLLFLLAGPTESLGQATADFSIDIKEGCIPLTPTFTDLSTGGTVISRTWNLGNGTIIPNGNVSAGANYLNDGKYYIVLTVTFAGGETLSKKD